ncbi:type II secretion system F family protein [Anaerotalea alkaliphila]|uniref:Type II secretion system protein GspF domain-containing protein n=1 Tax=Anaerotalea alkaliphila TaxID=2662126 RepID=A0A7X5KMG3_9FIRM|nr:type II secretion system F family protein [Anaerotalea alkaliphila]NDL66693.1 hypothetical protein [Anaerotalea alkaliphila]
MKDKETRSWVFRALGILGMILLGLVFFNNLFVALAVGSTGIFWMGTMEALYQERAAYALKLQFKDALYSVSASLGVGKSVENAFRSAVSDLQVIYPPGSRIVQVFQEFENQIAVNRNLEEILLEFSGEADIEEIRQFAEVFVIANRTGGDLTQVIQYTALRMHERMELEKEIEIITTEKRYELMLLMLLLPLIILYLKGISPSFTQVMYHTGLGRAVMLLGLGLYVAVFFIGRKIIRIEV